MLKIILLIVAAVVILAAIVAIVAVILHYTKVKEQHAAKREDQREMELRLTAPDGKCTDPDRMQLDMMQQELKRRLAQLKGQQAAIAERQQVLRDDYQRRYDQHVNVNGEDPETLDWDPEDIQAYKVNKALKREVRRRTWAKQDRDDEAKQEDVGTVFGVRDIPFSVKRDMYNELLEERLEAGRRRGVANPYSNGEADADTTGYADLEPEHPVGSPMFDVLVDEEYILGAYTQAKAEEDAWEARRAAMLGEVITKELFLKLDSRQVGRLTRTDLDPAGALATLYPHDHASLSPRDRDLIFKTMDANVDGSVDFDEFLAHAREARPQLFELPHPAAVAAAEPGKAMPTPLETPGVAPDELGPASPTGSPDPLPSQPQPQDPVGPDLSVAGSPQLQPPGEAAAASPPATAAADGGATPAAAAPEANNPPASVTSPHLISMREDSAPLRLSFADDADDPNAPLRALAGGAPLLSRRAPRTAAPTRDPPTTGGFLSRPRRNSNSLRGKARTSQPPPPPPGNTVPRSMAGCEPVANYLNSTR